MTNLSEIRVDIWSDIACPWCYIGKKRFEEGLKNYQESENALPVTVTFHSYQLSPDQPEQAEMSQAEYLSRRRGISVDEARNMVNQVAEVAETVGLNYDMDAVQMVNTRSAHRLIHKAKALGKQSEMKDALFDAYFVRGINVADRDELKKLAQTAGLTDADVYEALEAEEFDEKVSEDIAAARRIGVTSVPFFVFNDKYGMPGAQDVAQYTEIFNKVQELENEQ